MKKLLKLLMNAPVAIALAFLLVGAPGAPMAKMLPSSGEAVANVPVPPGSNNNSPGCSAPFSGEGSGSDVDCDGIPDFADPCPLDPSNTCMDDGADNGASWWEGYLDGDIGFGTEPDCQIKLIAGIKIAFCNDMDGDGDMEGSLCFRIEQADIGPWVGVNCPGDDD